MEKMCLMNVIYAVLAFKLLQVYSTEKDIARI